MVSEGGAVYFGEIPLPRGVTELAIKQAWWRESITSTAFLDRYPLVKLISLFEFEKIEDASDFLSQRPLSDFRITNATEILNAFKTDLEGIKGRYEFAKAVAPPPPPSVEGDGGKAGSNKNSATRLAGFGSLLLTLLII